MATITNSETVEARVAGSITKYLFKYTLSNGEVHQRRAWVPSTTNEDTERTFRGNLMLEELAAAETDRLLGEL